MDILNKIKVVENSDVSLYCYPDYGIVHHIMHRFVYGDTFRNLLTKGADVFIQYNCNKWLSDDKSSSALRQEDLEWGQQEWEPRVLKAGWDYWAMVMPEQILGQINRRKLVDRYKSQGVDVEVFSDVSEAFDWLTMEPA